MVPPLDSRARLGSIHTTIPMFPRGTLRTYYRRRKPACKATSNHERFPGNESQKRTRNKTSTNSDFFVDGCGRLRDDGPSWLRFKFWLWFGEPRQAGLPSQRQTLAGLPTECSRSSGFAAGWRPRRWIGPGAKKAEKV